MSESATTKAIRSLQEQLRAERVAHTATRNELQAEVQRVWRLVPSHYISLMGAYPALRKLLHVLAEAADLQDPAKGVDYENTMRTEYTPDGETLTKTERGVLTHRKQRAVVEEMTKQLEWLTHRLSKLVPGTETAYHPPDGECPECGRLIFQTDTGRKRSFCSTKCRVASSRKEVASG